MRRFLLGMLSGALLGMPLGVTMGWFLKDPVAELSAQDHEHPLYQGRSAASWLRQLEDRDAISRLEAVQALEKIGPGAEGVLPALSGLLKDSDATVRVAAAGALRRLGPAARPVLPALLAALADDNQFVRANV